MTPAIFRVLLLFVLMFSGACYADEEDYKKQDPIQILVFDDDLNQAGNEIFIRSIQNTLEAIQLDEEFFNTGENPLSTSNKISKFTAPFQFVRFSVTSNDCGASIDNVANWSRVGLILGPLTSGCTIKLLTLLEEKKLTIPVLNSTATRADINLNEEKQRLYSSFYRTVHSDDKRVLNVVNKLQKSQQDSGDVSDFKVYIFFQRDDKYSEGLAYHLINILSGKGVKLNATYLCFAESNVHCRNMENPADAPILASDSQASDSSQATESQLPVEIYDPIKELIADYDGYQLFTNKTNSPDDDAEAPNAVIFATSGDDKSMAGVRQFYWLVNNNFKTRFYGFGTPESYPFLRANSLLISMPTLQLYESQFSSKVAQFNPRQAHYLATVLATELTYKLMRDFTPEDKTFITQLAEQASNSLSANSGHNTLSKFIDISDSWCQNNTVLCFRLYANQTLSRETFRTQLTHEKYRFNHYGDMVSDMVSATLFKKEAQFNLKNREQVVVKPDDIIATVDRKFVQLFSGSILIAGNVTKPALNKNYKIRIRQQNNGDDDPEIINLPVAEDGSFSLKYTPMQMGGFDISFYRDKFRLQSQPLFFHVTLPSNPIWSLLIAFGATLLYHRDLVANRQFSRLRRPLTEALLATILFYVCFVILKEFFGDLTPPALNSDHSLNPGLIGLICAVLGMKVLDPIINVMKNIKSDNSG
ncbi:hypothetical protein [Thalassotalea mangrovi]|uniref:Receptor ligand binding region domain-containing protein n=1 Tax=Thalassotalea mangrovi TaxID=2572245 RepID=A0A4U1B1V9_9GAMM|nr:hypothetical protein [Thalassotalea mangrovi]TKB43346.1 hypothetical protein E8M12_15235 [Thalassotalea mangrovi]